MHTFFNFNVNPPFDRNEAEVVCLNDMLWNEVNGSCMYSKCSKGVLRQKFLTPTVKNFVPVEIELTVEISE